MKIVGREKLDAFCKGHADGRKPVEIWLAEVGMSAWTTPQQVKGRYAAASLLARNTVIFNIKGNSYRLETIVAYKTGVVVVEWIGTHEEYDARNRKR
jgi:mRNA interferase HigB